MTREQVMYLVEKLKELESMADVLIIDTGAGISDSVIEFVLSSAEVLLVTTPEPTSITDSYALLKTLNSRAGAERDGMVVKLVANRVASSEEAQNLYNKLNVVVQRFLKLKLEFLGMVPWDSNMSKSVMQQKPISIAYPNSEGAKALSRIAENLLGKTSAGEEEIQKKGLAAAIMKMLRNKK
jgi:flagellar biosynthesis protein FlhG